MKPMCINNKSARTALLSNSADTMRALDDARQSQADMYIWTIPKEMSIPLDYPEDCLFWTGTLGICPNKRQPGTYLLVPGAVSKMNIYGTAEQWVPSRIDPNTPLNMVGKRFNETEYPLLQLPSVPAYAVSGYAEIMGSSLISMGQNIVAMRQPILISGQMGNVAIRYAASMLTGGDTYVPVIADAEGKSMRELTVLDLKATNFIDPLTGAVDAASGWMHRILGIDAAATQKASGVSENEVSRGDARVEARRQHALEHRQMWCDRVYETVGVDLWCELRGDPGDDPGNGEEDTVGDHMDGAADPEGAEEEQKM